MFDRKTLNLCLEEEQDADIKITASESPLESMKTYVNMGFYDLASQSAAQLGGKEKEEKYRKIHKATTLLL